MDFKQKFIDYAKGKVKDLGNQSYIDPVWEEEISEKVLMISNIRNYKDLKVVADLQEYDEPLKALDENGKLVIKTQQYDAQMLAADLMFSAIDTEFYNNLVEYWNELPMDEYMQNNEEEKNAQDTIDLRDEELGILNRKTESNNSVYTCMDCGEDKKESMNEAKNNSDEIAPLNIDANKFIPKLNSDIQEHYFLNKELYNKYGDIMLVYKDRPKFSIYLYRDKKTNKINVSISVARIQELVDTEEEAIELINKNALHNLEESKLIEDNKEEYEYLLKIRISRNNTTDSASLSGDIEYIRSDIKELIKNANSGITDVIVEDLEAIE